MAFYAGLAAVLFAIAILFMGVTVVRQGYQYTIERFGRFTYVARPGLTVIVPFFDRIGRRINMMEQVLDIPGQELITKDNAMVAVDGVVFFQVLDAAKAAYEVSDLYLAIMQLATTNLRTGMGSIKRAGPWKVPPRIRVLSGMGSVVLDFCDADNPHPVVEVELNLGAGSAKLLVPDDATVDVDNLVSGMGSVRSNVPSANTTSTPQRKVACSP